MPVSQIIRRRSALFSMAAAAALLAACGQDAAETDTAETQDGEQAQSQATDLVVTASSDELESPLTAVHALPNADIVYNGVVAGAPESGGLTIFNVDGGVVAEQAGPAYGSLAASSGFQLRGSALPLIAAANLETGTVDFIGFSAEQSALLEVPVSGLDTEIEIRAVCTADSDQSRLDFFALGADGQVERWRVRDTGAEQLSAERVTGFDAPFSARRCAYDPAGGALYVSSPLSQLARIDANGEATAQRDLNVSGMGFAVLSGQGNLAAATGDSVQLLDPNSLETSQTLTFGPGLTVPALVNPGALDVSGETYGGAYPDGFLAVSDGSDRMLKFIDYGYVERSLSEPENRFAPKPPRES